MNINKFQAKSIKYQMNHISFCEDNCHSVIHAVTKMCGAPSCILENGYITYRNISLKYNLELRSIVKRIEVGSKKRIEVGSKVYLRDGWEADIMVVSDGHYISETIAIFKKGDEVVEVPYKENSKYVTYGADHKYPIDVAIQLCSRAPESLVAHD